MTIVRPGRIATSIAERYNTRLGAADRALPDELQSIAAAMREAPAGVSAADPGRMVVEAGRAGQRWVVPGAEQDRRLLEHELSELLAAFPGA